VTRSRSGPTSRAEFINLFGSETRVQILAFLWDCKHPTTADIARAVRADPSTVETHCKRLQEATLLRTREGGKIEYWQLTMKGDTAAGKIAKPMLQEAPDPSK